jgi:hypothetical protein
MLSDFLGLALAARAAGSALDFVLVHGFERFAHAEEQHHEPPLGELGVVYEVRVDHILQVAAPVVGEQDVYGFRGGVGLVVFNRIVYRVDNVGVRREERVCFDFLEREAHAFLAKGTSYLLEREQLLI